MIKIEIVIDKRGCLQGFTASGHAGLAVKKGDILCAAITTLLRTTAKLIYANPRIKASGSTGERGKMQLAIQTYGESELDWIRGITDFCQIGINDLKNEYPQRIQLNINLNNTD